MLESDLWLMFRKACPYAERIENAAKEGTPDVVYPTKTGWGWCELKIAHNNVFWLEKTQFSYAARNARLPISHQVRYLIWNPEVDGGKLIISQDLITYPKVAKGGKIMVSTNELITWNSFQNLVNRMRAYTGDEGDDW